VRGYRRSVSRWGELAVIGSGVGRLRLLKVVVGRRRRREKVGEIVRFRRPTVTCSLTPRSPSQPRYFEKRRFVIPWTSRRPMRPLERWSTSTRQLVLLAAAESEGGKGGSCTRERRRIVERSVPNIGRVHARRRC
jgi:hypothetical protein